MITINDHLKEAAGTEQDMVDEKSRRRVLKVDSHTGWKM